MRLIHLEHDWTGTAAMLSSMNTDRLYLLAAILVALVALVVLAATAADVVHVEPRDIFNYLVRVPPLMRGRRLVLLHHGNVLTERGWERFVREYGTNLMGRSGAAFSVMTDSIMERFLDHLGYEILVKDTDSVPRDCAWVVRAPEPQGRQMPALTSATSES